MLCIHTVSRVRSEPLFLLRWMDGCVSYFQNFVVQVTSEIFLFNFLYIV